MKARKHLKILYVIDNLESNYPRDQNYIIQYMAQKGHIVEVITSKGSYDSFDSQYFSGISIHRYKTVSRIKRARVFFNPRFLRILLTRYDIVHCFTFFTFSSTFYAPIIRGQTKIIRSEIEFADNLEKLGLFKFPYSWILIMYKKIFSFFTSYTSTEKRSLELIGIISNKIITLPIMVDYNKFASLNSTPSEFLQVGTISRLSPEKGIHRLVEIMQDLVKKAPDESKRISFKLAGRKDDEKYANQAITQLDCCLNVNFQYLGEIAPPYCFYTSVDVVIVPSISETGAIVVLEAMASGKIVIASNIYPINTYIQNGHNGFLFNDASEASDILLSLLRKRVNLAEIINNAKATAKIHDYETVCEELEHVYLHN